MKAEGAARILQNALFLVSGRLFSRIMQFFLFIYAARRLGVEGFGIFSYGYAIINMFAVAMDWGISAYMVQQLSRNPSRIRAFMGKTLAVKAGMVVPCLLGILLAGVAMHKETEVLWILFVLGMVTVWDGFAITFYSVFEAREEMAYPAAVVAISNLIMSAAGILGLFYAPGLFLLCVIYAGGALLRLSFAGILCIRHYGRPVWEKESPKALELIQKGLPFALVTVFVTIYYYIDTVILSAFFPDETIGQYNAAYRLLEAPLFVAQAATTALFPAAARMYTAKREELKEMMAGVVQKTCAFGLSIAIVIALISERLIVLVYGDTYRPAAPLLTVLIFSAALIMPGAMCGTAIRAANRQSVSALITGMGVLLNVVLNLLVIPRYAAIGAAWTTLATEALTFLLNMLIIRQLIGPMFRRINILQLSLLAALWIGLITLTQTFWVLYQIILCTLLFFPFLLGTRIITLTEIQVLTGKDRQP